MRKSKLASGLTAAIFSATILSGLFIFPSQTLAGMTSAQFDAKAKAWLKTADARIAADKKQQMDSLNQSKDRKNLGGRAAEISRLANNNSVSVAQRYNQMQSCFKAQKADWCYDRPENNR